MTQWDWRDVFTVTREGERCVVTLSQRMNDKTWWMWANGVEVFERATIDEVITFARCLLEAAEFEKECGDGK